MSEAEKLVSRLRIIPERTDQRAGDRLRVLLLDTAHHHAQVHGLDDDADAARVQDFADGLGDLIRQPFLDWKATRENLHEPRQLGETNNPARGDVSDMGLAEERQKVVLA